MNSLRVVLVFTFCAYSSLASAVDCKTMVYQEAVAYSQRTAKETWFDKNAASAEDNARKWLGSIKGKESLDRAKRSNRNGCI
jgi:hypothetical protein